MVLPRTLQGLEGAHVDIYLERKLVKETLHCYFLLCFPYHIRTLSTMRIRNPSIMPWSRARILIALLAMLPIVAPLSQYQTNGE